MPLSDDALLMSFAALAYDSPNSLSATLASHAPLAGWQIAWLPVVGPAPDNFLFAASDGQGHVIIAIRGTYPDPFSRAYWDDGNEDTPFGDMQPWPGAPGAKISNGTNVGFGKLMALQNASGQSISAFVGSLPTETDLAVTGHSLGGTLAPVLALALAGKSNLSIRVTTFAGLTPGNAEFAALFGAGTRFDGRVRRVYNTLDTVAYGWDRVLAAYNFYQPAPQGDAVVKAMLIATDVRLRLGNYNFTAIGDAVPLTGVLQPLSIHCQLVAYVLENLHQHLPDTYLTLLDAPLLPFALVWGASTVPRDHALLQRPTSSTAAALHL